MMRYRPSSSESSTKEFLPRSVDELKVHQVSTYKTLHTIRFILFRWRATVAFLICISIFFFATVSWREQKVDFAPRYVRYLVEDDFAILNHLDMNIELYPSKRETPGSSHSAIARQEHLKDSHSYDHGRADEFETEDCKSQYSWQLSTFPTCNSLFEVDLLDQVLQSRKSRILAHGYWRDVWSMKNPGNNTASDNEDRVVCKTMRYQHDFEERNYDRHRRDAVAMERLTKSKMVVNIYGFCGNSGLFEFAGGGSLSDAIWPKKTNKDTKLLSAKHRLKAAAQASMGLASMHNMEVEGLPAMAHTDISPSQFVATNDNIYRLNDFNRARFLRKRDDGTLCGYEVGRNPGKNRSPEEYNYEDQSEKVDIYSFGNILYMLLTNMWPFEEESDKEAVAKVKKGERPPIPKEILDSTDPSIKILKETMFMCHEQDPAKRATAREVETFIVDALLRQYPDALKIWSLEEEYEGVDRSRYRERNSRNYS